MHSVSYHQYGPLVEVLPMQSVPVFLILMGTVGALSFNRSGKIDYITYFLKRVRRLVVPLIPIFFVTILISIVYGKQMYLGWANLVGEMPVSGPGSYFIYLALASIIIIPILWYVSRKISMGFVLTTSFLISLNLELFPQTNIVAMVLRNLFFFAVGIYLAGVVTTRKVPRILYVCIAISTVILLLFIQYQPFIKDTVYGNCMTAFFTVGLILIPILKDWSWTPINLLGKMSWHLFLVQMTVLLVFNYGLIVNLLVIVPIGFLLYYLDTTVFSFKSAVKE